MGSHLYASVENPFDELSACEKNDPISLIRLGSVPYSSYNSNKKSPKEVNVFDLLLDPTKKSDLWSLVEDVKKRKNLQQPLTPQYIQENCNNFFT